MTMLNIFFITGIEDQENWHGKALGAKGDACIAHLQSLIANGAPKLSPAAPVDDAPSISIANIRLSDPPAYKMGDKVATRMAYGTALVKIGKNNNRVVALDAEVKNSTFAIKFKVRSALKLLSASHIYYTNCR